MTMMRVSGLFGTWGAVCGLALAGLCLAGCQSGSSDVGQASGPAGAPDSSAGSAAGPGAVGTSEDNLDLIRVGDTLVISFADLPIVQPPEEQRVKDDKTITLMQNQTFEAAGKTRGRLEKEIRARYVPRFFRNMTVSVHQKQETQFYFVDGEVKTPTRQIYISRTTVLKAIASAGGFTDFARKSKVKLTRVDGRIFIIDCKKALKDPRLDLEVFPGDKINVPRRVI